jgi:hypothetical protein
MKALPADLITSVCLHSFKNTAHLYELVLSFRGVDLVAKTANGQAVLDPD